MVMTWIGIVRLPALAFQGPNEHADHPIAIVQRLALSRRDHRSLHLAWLRCDRVTSCNLRVWGEPQLGNLSRRVPGGSRPLNNRPARHRNRRVFAAFRVSPWTA